MMTPKTVAIVQSSYIPWKGYFDLLRQSDLFVLYDDAQYTTRDWRNRNRIKTKDGLLWLSIPVEVHGHRDQRVRDAKIAQAGWNHRHWKAIASAYARAPHFKDSRDRLEDLFARATSPWLSEVNRHFIDGFSGWLGITTPLRWSSDFDLVSGKSERLAAICAQAGATTYLSGPAAREYLSESVFAAAGIAVRYMDYGGYPAYPQVHGAFEHAVSIVDLLVHTGSEAPRYLLPF